MDGWLTIKTKLDTKDFSKEIDVLQDKIDDLEATLNMDNSNGLFSTRDIREMEAELERAKNKMSDLKKKQNELNNPTSGGGFSKMTKDLKGVVKSAARAALAVFGIRSAYLAVRSAASTLSQYNSQLAADLEYIRFAIAKSLEPLITKLVSLAYQLLAAINQISIAWFGVNLFANASVGAMKKASDSAEKMKKSLAGFDEINKLSENNGGSDIGAGSPSLDLSKMQGETPQWLQFIMDNGDYILALLGGIIAGVEAFKLGLSGIQALGFGVTIAGVILLIESLIKYIKDPSWENFGQVLISIGVILGGLAIAFSSTGLAIAAAIVLLTGVIATFWEDIRGYIEKCENALDNAVNWIKNNFNNPIGALLTTVLGVIRTTITTIKQLLDGLFSGIKQIINGIIQIFKGDLKGGIQTALNGIWTIIKSIFSSAWTFVKGILNSMISGIEMAINSAIRGINSLLSGLRNLGNKITSLLGFGEVFGTISTISLPRLATGGIVNVPNTGVVMGNAIVGEAGAEGVLPLTNPDTMAMLGQEIGKWITVNIDMTNEIDGRVLNRRLQSIKNNNNFAINGR